MCNSTPENIAEEPALSSLHQAKATVNTNKMSSILLTAAQKSHLTPPCPRITINNKVDKNYTAILILTYRRSGSTFMGKIMEYSPGSFYVFEPFRLIEQAYNARKQVRLNDGQLK